MKVTFFFKIFNNIKSEHESKDLAKIELNSLFGEVEVITNFMDFMSQSPLKFFMTKKFRIQDIISFELPYGRIQGYYAERNDIFDITNLIKRLAYIREIFLIMETKSDPETILQEIFKEGIVGKNVQFFIKNDYILFRFITNQYFLEKSEYISKLSRSEAEIDSNVDILFSHLFENIYRIPSSSTLAVGKQLEDWFAIREEPSLYLNHYMHAYKGKFHPKMTRALINYVFNRNKGAILDNFAGSGTALVEANYLGLDAFGIEINPLSVLMTNVKCNSVKIPISKLRKEIAIFVNKLEKVINHFEKLKQGQQLLIDIPIDIKKINETKNNYKEILAKRNFSNISDDLINAVILAKEVLKTVTDKAIHDFLLLSISGTISDSLRRRKANFLEILNSRLNNLYLRLYLYQKLNSVLKIRNCKAKCFVGDTREMHVIKSNSVDGIVNSPPYSTAIDYIGNDYPQLVLLDMVDSFSKLEAEMMGNPRVNFDRKTIQKMIDGELENPLVNSSIAMKYVKLLVENGRPDVGHRTFKFFLDMFYTLKEMHRVLKNRGKAAIVIGNNHYKINEHYQEIPNDDVLLEMAKEIGFKKDLVIKRDLHKTQVGNIRRETVLFIQK
ncbi:MAG: site-specific DNA-methyltransferase [Candidatus Heimdallarchaeota archaeon]|nr:site-specific DNA-methyltransferase [Candidatus Heimdallarchaeota archaeon]